MATTPPIAIIMGSQSDWPTLRPAAALLTEFGVAYHCAIVSAHRTPDWMAEFGRTAADNGYQVIIAAAGGAAHLPGMVASHTTLPVLGVPIKSKSLKGVDSLYSMVQMPAGVPVGTLAIGEAGAKNAALLALRILALSNPTIAEQLHTFAITQRDAVLASSPVDDLFHPIS